MLEGQADGAATVSGTLRVNFKSLTGEANGLATVGPAALNLDVPFEGQADGSSVVEGSLALFVPVAFLACLDGEAYETIEIDGAVYETLHFSEEGDGTCGD